MLRHLHIRNYALIKKLDIDFDKGFSAITGETGAGKSIMIGALNLLAGQRADTKVLLEDAEKCVIEATFDISLYCLSKLFESLDLDYSDECVIRREISRSGKSRAFVNDSPVQLSVMKEVASHLFDIHSQHQNLLLNDPSFLLGFVDAIAGNDKEREDYRLAYNDYLKAKREYDNFIKNAGKDSGEADYWRYQLEQISNAKLRDGEQEELEEELNVLTHAEEIKTGIYSISELFDSDDGGILTALKKQVGIASSLQQLFPQANALGDRLESAYLELKDIAYEVSGLADDVTFDQERLENVNARLDLIYSLQQKFHAATIADLLHLADDISAKLSAIENYDEQKELLEKQLASAHAEAENAASALGNSRSTVFESISNEIETVLHGLGMPNGKVKIVSQTKAELSPSGKDELSMLFTANKNRELQDASQVASGGELARLMLAVKSIICRVRVLPTIIFDEIDTGVSGEIAAKMGDMMKEMGQRMQVLSITHLPQIAAKGARQYKVYKEDDGDSTATNIRLLDDGQRVNELALMLSGNTITQAAIDNAKELLRNE
ncbi:MAG TPA: DNA repair protein RecN [Candidatus Avibacteroides faecavium]|nr:DNA repair protein RecN [Candidatus Avibacteroides faecavium]